MYERIKPIEDGTSRLENPELKALAVVWHEKREILRTHPEHEEFLKRLKREWAIETGLIERLYHWDRGVTETLIEQGIESSLIASSTGLRREEATHIKNLIDDQYQAIEALFQFIKGEQPFSEYFVRGMHQVLTDHQVSTEAQTQDGSIIQVPLRRGDYKILPNNPRRSDGEMHLYSPPEIVRDEMQQLVAWYGEYELQYAPEVLSAWLHHRFTQIHPFQDGNGRVARVLASLVFLKAGLFPLVVRDEDRKLYIAALEAADANNLDDLIHLFAARQRDAILKALGVEQQVRQAGYADKALQSGLKILKDRLQKRQESLAETFSVADVLRDVAVKRFSDMVENLNKNLYELTPPDAERAYKSVFKQADNNDTKRIYYSGQIIETARHLKYFANTIDYRSWASLVIHTETSFEMIISFHGYGPSYNGILAASAFTFQRISHEDGSTEYTGVSPCADLFQFNYAESVASTETRFKVWLDDALAIGLGEWQRSL